MKELAKSNLARFDWWIQTKFNVLPTDERFINLTDEQKELLLEHYLIDNPDKASNGAASDSEYDNELDKNEREAKEEYDKEKYADTLPLPDEGETESFADPEFDAEWDKEDVDEDEPEDSSQVFEEGEQSSKEDDSEDDGKWEVL